MKEGTFIKLNYTGLLDDGTVFDTTEPDVAKKHGLKGKLEPVTICLGERQLLPGLDQALLEKGLGKHEVTLKPEHAFGKKSTEKLELVPKNQLQSQGVTPKPGMELEIDGKYGRIKNVSGGRVVVDFNHPLASRDVTYKVDVLEEVTDLKEQVDALLSIAQVPYDDVIVDGKNITITTPQLYPQPVMDALQQKITQLTEAENVSFEQGKKYK